MTPVTRSRSDGMSGQHLDRAAAGLSIGNVLDLLFPEAKMATKKKTPTKKPQDAIALLKQDHEKVRSLLGSLEKATGARREKLLGQVEQELKIHTTIEEELFYPAFREAARKKDDQVMTYEAYNEHHVVDLVLPEAREGKDAE